MDVSNGIVDVADKILTRSLKSRYSYLNPVPDSMIGKTVLEVLDYILSKYQNDDFKDAISTGHEVIFNCKEYYIVSLQYEDALEKLIW